MQKHIENRVQNQVLWEHFGEKSLLCKNGAIVIQASRGQSKAETTHNVNLLVCHDVKCVKRSTVAPTTCSLLTT